MMCCGMNHDMNHAESEQAHTHTESALEYSRSGMPRGNQQRRI